MKFESSTRKIFKSNEYLKKKTHVHVARQVSMIWADLEVQSCLRGVDIYLQISAFLQRGKCIRKSSEIALPFSFLSTQNGFFKTYLKFI